MSAYSGLDVNLADIIEMNLPSLAAAAKRARCSAATLNKACLEEYGESWNDIAQRRKLNHIQEIANERPEKLYYI